MSRTFLTAEWKHLILMNYAVPPIVLEPFLPPECDLDMINGTAFISLVAFQFLNTRVMGIRWPGYRNFPEINLRFYILRKNRRAVCFIREYVPSRLIAALARGIYNEPYRKAKMSMRIDQQENLVIAHYGLQDGALSLSMSVTGTSPVFLPEEDSAEHFFKEHNLGVGVDKKGNLIEYEVRHPVWKVFPVRHFNLSINWQSLYGEYFAFLQDQEPDSVCFAQGSPVRVSTRTRDHNRNRDDLNSLHPS